MPRNKTPELNVLLRGSGRARCQADFCIPARRVGLKLWPRLCRSTNSSYLLFRWLSTGKQRGTCLFVWD